MEKYFHFDREKSIEELEGQEWDEPNFDSNVVVKCYTLRKKSIHKFTNEDLRIMIGQKIGLNMLVPLALETISDNILAEGDYYPGDLLEMLLKIDSIFWKVNPIYKKDLESILIRNIEDLSKKLKEFQNNNK